MREGLKLIHWWGTPQNKENMAKAELATKTTIVTQTITWLKLYLVLFVQSVRERNVYAVAPLIQPCVRNANLRCPAGTPVPPYSPISPVS